MTNYSKPITLRADTKVDIHATVTYRDMKLLFPICKWGLPDVISNAMRERLQVLVCLCLNPYRSLWSREKEYGESTDG